jgi:hypothetical protein
VSIDHYKIQGLKIPHYNRGYIAVTLHKRILISYLPQTILKVTPRNTILLIALPWQPSSRLKHHYQQVKLVGSVTVVQPDSSGQDQTVPTAPLEVPPLEVAAVKPLWPAELLPTPRAPQPAAASRRCSIIVSTSRYREHQRPPGG